MLLFNLLLNAVFSMVALYIFNKTKYKEGKRKTINQITYFVYKISLIVLTLVPITSCLVKVTFFYYITNIAILNLVLISIVLAIRNLKPKN